MKKFILFISFYLIISSPALAQEYWAELDDYDIVKQVIVADEKFIKTLKNSNKWIKTDKKRQLRKNYAGIGYKYDRERDAFILPKPFNSWILDEEKAQWKAPKEMPQDNKLYNWDEKTLNWIEVKPLIETRELQK